MDLFWPIWTTKQNLYLLQYDETATDGTSERDEVTKLDTLLKYACTNTTENQRESRAPLPGRSSQPEVANVSATRSDF